MTANLCRRSSSPMDVDDLLSEIFLRLPPQPSSLARASLVCRRWRRLVSDPVFLRHFRIHHRRSPPLLGCFIKTCREFYFKPAMEHPDRVPLRRFSLRSLRGGDFRPLGCRHGLVLIYYWDQLQVLVCDPVNGDQHRIALAPGFNMVKAPMHLQGTVLRAGTDAQHFQVVLVGMEVDIQLNLTRVIACVYSSETGRWGDLISTTLPSGAPTMVYMGRPSVLVGNSLYWLIAGNFVRIVEFDLERQSLAVTAVPMDMHGGSNCRFSLMRADDGGLGFLSLSHFSAQLWMRKTCCDGAASWVLGRTVELDRLLSLNLPRERTPLKIQGFAEENNVVFLLTALGVFMIWLDSLHSKMISETTSCYYYPF